MYDNHYQFIHFFFNILGTATTTRDYSHIWVECTQMEQELDAIELHKIKHEVQREELRKLRRLMLTRLGQLETKAKRKYLLIVTIE